MKVYNLSDVAPNPNTSWESPADICRNGTVIPAGGSAELTKDSVEDFQAAFGDKLAFGELPGWYAELKGVKEKPKKGGRKKKSAE